PESLDLAEVVAALRLGDGDFCQAKFERRIITREDRTRIDGHAPWIGGKLRDGIAACSKARIGRKHVVQYHRLALLPRLVPRLRDSRGFVLDTNALGRSGDELVLRGVYVEAVGVGKAGAVLDAVFLEGKDRSVRAEAQNIEFRRIAGIRGRRGAEQAKHEGKACRRHR